MAVSDAGRGGGIMTLAPAIRVRARRNGAGPRAAAGKAAKNRVVVISPSALPPLPPEWRAFVGHWLESAGCVIRDAARGDWEIELSPALRRRELDLPVA